MSFPRTQISGIRVLENRPSFLELEFRIFIRPISSVRNLLLSDTTDWIKSLTNGMAAVRAEVGPGYDILSPPMVPRTRYVVDPSMAAFSFT